MSATAAQDGLTQRVPARDDGGGASAAAVSSGPTKKPVGGRATTTTTSSSSKRGLRSLAAAVTLSAALTALSFFFAATANTRHSSSSSTSLVALVRAGSVASEAVLSLALWMAWAEGGVHARPAATLLPYAAHLLASLAWPPLVLGRMGGLAAAGLACCGAMAGGAAACARGFGNVNPVAGDLAKPAVAWALILAVINYKML